LFCAYRTDTDFSIQESMKEREMLSLADHLDSPRNQGDMQDSDGVGMASIGGRPPYVTFFVQVEAGEIRAAQYVTFGCGFSIAACSALTEMVQGATLLECLKLNADSLCHALGGLPPHKKYCAALAITAMHHAVEDVSQEGEG